MMNMEAELRRLREEYAVRSTTNNNNNNNVNNNNEVNNGDGAQNELLTNGHVSEKIEIKRAKMEKSEEEDNNEENV